MAMMRKNEYKEAMKVRVERALDTLKTGDSKLNISGFHKLDSKQDIFTALKNALEEVCFSHIKLEGVSLYDETNCTLMLEVTVR